jgi:hypothetical protein
MSLWRRAHTEVAGAWRSLRYDLGRSQPGPGEQLLPGPRRLAAVSAFGVLAVAGAAGSYFAVVNGLDSLVDDRPAGAEPYPLATETPRRAEGDQANAGLGRGTATTAGRVPAAAGRPAPAGRAPAAAGTTAAGTTAAGTRAAGTRAVPPRQTIGVLPATTAAVPVPPEVTLPGPWQTGVGGPRETWPTGCCSNPPVPTPTAPAPSPHSTSATPSPTASPSNHGGSPEPSGSPSYSAPPEPDDTAGPGVSAGLGKTAGPVETSSSDPTVGSDGGRGPRHARRH